MNYISNKKLFIVVNVDWFFLSHRLPIAFAAKKQGYKVTVITKDTGRKSEILKKGLDFIDLPFERSGSNPLHELYCIYSLYKLYKRNKPDIIHHVTLKGSLLGSFAAKLAKVKSVVNAISGFGYNFTDERDGIKQKTIKYALRLAFKSRCFYYIFQNPDDVKEFVELNLVTNSQIHIIKGSGVDLDKFSYQKEILKDKVRVLLPARMLYDKGVIEYINAAKVLKKELEIKAEFLLMGDCDTHNLAGIKEEDLKEMMDMPYLNWTGFEENVFLALKNADIVVLPSYREGLPKSLIEACAVGRPIITTDTQGCRECVIDGYNGYLVPTRDYEQLAEKMKLLIENPLIREKMGLRSRILAEKEFSIGKVIEEHLKVYNEIIKQ